VTIVGAGAEAVSPLRKYVAATADKCVFDGSNYTVSLNFHMGSYGEEPVPWQLLESAFITYLVSLWLSYSKTKTIFAFPESGTVDMLVEKREVLGSTFEVKDTNQGSVGALIVFKTQGMPEFYSEWFLESGLPDGFAKDRDDILQRSDPQKFILKKQTVEKWVDQHNHDMEKVAANIANSRYIFLNNLDNWDKQVLDKLNSLDLSDDEKKYELKVIQQRYDQQAKDISDNINLDLQLIQSANDQFQRKIDDYLTHF